MRGFLKYVLPAILYCLLIFLISSLSDPPAPDFKLEWGDKINHAGAFGLMMLLVFRAVRWMFYGRSMRVQLWIALLYCALYGITDELHQMYVPNRHGDPFDLLADIVGASLGVLFIMMIHRQPLGRAVFGFQRDHGR